MEIVEEPFGDNDRQLLSAHFRLMPLPPFLFEHLNMDPANTVLESATTAQEELPLVAFQNLTLASRPICPT